jgi:uncharacterized membrane protein
MKLDLRAESPTPEEWEMSERSIDDLRHLTLSGVWLLYSVALLVAGFFRSSRGIRIVSIALFGVTILKVFLYDLSFLETVYRIVLFVGLGLVLFAVSYAYQRYRERLLPSDLKEGL